MPANWVTRKLREQRSLPHQFLEVFRALGLLARTVAADQSLGHQRLQTGIKGLHAQRATGLDR